DLHVSAVELGLDLRHVAEFGGADRGEVLRMREEDGPGVADPVMETDRAFRGLSLEVRGGIAELKSHLLLLPSGGLSLSGRTLDSSLVGVQWRERNFSPWRCSRMRPWWAKWSLKTISKSRKPFHVLRA